MADLGGAAGVELVRRLVARQLPRSAGLPVTPVSSGGTANAIFRLGDDLAVRLPRTVAAREQVAKEARWLPVLAPALPLRVPEPVATGAPDEGFPWPWAVHRWLPGDDAYVAPVENEDAAADALAERVVALRSQDATGAPLPGAHNFGRGVALAERDDLTRGAIAECAGLVDTDAATAAWEDALAAPPWDGPPAWLHGDLSPSNLLVRDGRLSAVIDWGGLAAGDPACDLLAAWTCLRGPARRTYRDRAATDETSWRRGRGWALSVAVVALPYYRDTNPVMERTARRTIAEVLDERD